MRKRPLLLLAMAAGIVRVGAVLASSPHITPDTFDYARQSRLPLFSASFWGSQHPPLVPLAWKLLPGIVQRGDPSHVGDLAPALLLNAAAGAACWGLLALTVASLARSRAGRVAGALAVLALSLAPEVAGWDTAALSESLSLSLTALVAALALRYAVAPSRARALALAAAVLPFALVRDTNVPLAVLALAPLLVAVRRRHTAVVAAALAAAVALSLFGQAHGRRSDIPTRNAIAIEIAGGHGAWFRARGMAVTSSTVALLLERPARSFDSDPRASVLRAWLRGHGRATWLAYLRTHPARTTSMLANLDEVYDPSHATLALYWSRVDLTGFFPRGALLAALALLAAGGAWLSRTRATLVLASLAAATLPLAMLIWDSDALEFERHAIVVPVLARVAVLGLLVPVVDAVAARVADQRGEYAAVSIPK